MSVRSDLVTVGHLETNREVARRSHRVAFQDSQLRAGRQEGRRRSELNLVGCERVLSIGWLHSQERSQCGKTDNEKRQFHESLQTITLHDCSKTAGIIAQVGLSFPYWQRIVGDENCCVVVSGLSKHTSGRKPTF